MPPVAGQDRGGRLHVSKGGMTLKTVEARRPGGPPSTRARAVPPHRTARADIRPRDRRCYEPPMIVNGGPAAVPCRARVDRVSDRRNQPHRNGVESVPKRVLVGDRRADRTVAMRSRDEANGTSGRAVTSTPGARAHRQCNDDSSADEKCADRDDDALGHPPPATGRNYARKGVHADLSSKCIPAHSRNRTCARLRVGSS